jgi:hypothetical protein
VDQGVPVPPKSAKLSGWLPYWLDNVIKPRRKLSTFDTYEAHVRLYLVPLLGSKRLESLGVADVRRFLVRASLTRVGGSACGRGAYLGAPRGRARRTSTLSAMASSASWAGSPRGVLAERVDETLSGLCWRMC